MAPFSAGGSSVPILCRRSCPLQCSFPLQQAPSFVISPSTPSSAAVLGPAAMNLAPPPGAGAPVYREMECTAYCACGYCCNWEWGVPLPGPFYVAFCPKGFPLQLRSRKPCKHRPGALLPPLCRFWTATKLVGAPYYGLTASGKVPVKGTVAADTKFYPFGTPMLIPGYGWGKVEDRGGAIVGESKIDVYYPSHTEALQWGRRKLKVKIILPDDPNGETQTKGSQDPGVTA
ncbi:hypothetical protein Taro_013278 [Colocasia esculenta]|uniref:3D domain-containing protein n=1 Tax=Colocasia esculenta TaxID=4460 RepID=A0A843UFJ2_COLES|nr:hypothetical protein [Colocasia esculenta]